MLLKVSIPTERGNALALEGRLGPIIKDIMDDLQPESAYWVEDNGLRTGYIVVNVAEPSEIPKVAEPFFLALNARVEFHPAMVLEDLMKASAHIERAVAKYGGRASAPVA